MRGDWLSERSSPECRACASMPYKRLKRVRCGWKDLLQFNQLLQVVVGTKSRLSGLLPSGLQASGVCGLRSTRRACFFRSFDLGLLVPLCATLGSLGSCQCRLLISGAAIGKGSGGGSAATGTTELM